ncbi:hypothetical protein ALP48_102676 [Pseudomonas syringae pv. solidagae]|uniref:Uncharacterized protein n=1 Tax=Pseudomonas syringae pv. solidagae TaxID=264458 RepID=A0A3M5KT76_PSESX|nr:hypothetical protein ALP48_102676 [Pseudomonas syringae pv. solidagae]
MTTNSDLGISWPSEADQAISRLHGIVQLAQPGQFPRLAQVCRRPLITLGLLRVEHTATQRGGNAHHAVQIVLDDEVTPLQCHILLVLRRHDIGRRAVYTVLIEEQPDNFMPACQHRPGELQGSPRGGRMRGGKKGDGEFHDRLCQQNMRNDKEFKGRRVSLARADPQMRGQGATA